MPTPPPPPARITVVEDEPDIASVVRDYLVHAGHEVQVWDNGQVALQALLAAPPDLLVLDIMLPELDGISILQQLRAVSQTPVIMVTARVEEVDRLLALEAGADDYLCKPFSPRELVARVHAVLRRSRATTPAPQSTAALLMHCAARKVLLEGKELALTPKEFDVLGELMRRPGHVYARQQLLERLYADELDVSDRAIDSHIKNLRKKLADCHPEAAEWIRSVYGVGFALELPEGIHCQQND